MKEKRETGRVLKIMSEYHRSFSLSLNFREKFNTYN